MTTRIELNNRRTGITNEITIDGLTVNLVTGEYEDGRLGEIFIFLKPNCDKIQIPFDTFEGLLSAFSTTVSLGLQYGVPLNKFVDQFTGTKFNPSGLVRGHETIKISSSILDFIFRELAITYLNQKEWGNVQ